LIFTFAADCSIFTSLSLKGPGLAARIIHGLIDNEVIVRRKLLDFYHHILGIFTSFSSKGRNLAVDIIDGLIYRDEAVSRKLFDFKLSSLFLLLFQAPRIS
jgi:hypothetical protein